MADRISKKKRSAIMSAIRSKNNKSTEIAMMRLLKLRKIIGWRRHLPLPGKPDFTWRKEKIALFVDGCFWHGCKKCYEAPKSNASFWAQKINYNKAKDKRINKTLKKLGWTVIRVKECQLKSERHLKYSFVKLRLKFISKPCAR